MTQRSEFTANSQLSQTSSLRIGRSFHIQGKGYRKPRGVFAFLRALLASF